MGDEAGNSIVDGSDNVCLGHFAGVGIVHAVTRSQSASRLQVLILTQVQPASSAASSMSRLSDPGSTHAVCVDQFNVISDCTAAAGGKPQAMLDRKVEELQKQVEILTAQLKEQAAQIQKVSAQLEVTKPAPQVVANKP